MRKETFHVVTVRTPGTEKDRIFVRHPDGRLVEDERGVQEIVNAAAEKEGTGDIVEVAARYTTSVREPQHVVDATRRCTCAILRKDHDVASPWDVDFEIEAAITMYHGDKKRSINNVAVSRTRPAR